MTTSTVSSTIVGNPVILVVMLELLADAYALWASLN